MNDERLNKLLWLIQSLPADQIVIIAEKCKGLWEISPKVQKLISVFDKLSDEEKNQFFRNVMPPKDANMEWCDAEPISEGSEPSTDSAEGSE
jgi:hypothetical protein